MEHKKLQGAFKIYNSYEKGHTTISGAEQRRVMAAVLTKLSPEMCKRFPRLYCAALGAEQRRLFSTTGGGAVFPRQSRCIKTARI